MEDIKTIKNLLIFFAIVLIFYLLKELSVILLPFILALLAALLLQPLISYLQKFKIPKWLILPSVAVLSLSFFYGIGFILSDTTTQIYDQRDFLFSKLLLKTDSLLSILNKTFKLKLDTTLLVSQIYKSADSGTISGFLSNIAGGIGSLFSAFLFFSLYFIMLLAGMANYKEFLSYVGAAQKEAVLRDYEHVQKSIVSYMLIKTLISLATGLLTFTICSAFDISFAIFWGFIAFIFNFIPNIGSIASVILPLTMAFIQLEDFQIIIFFALLLVSIHFTIGNLIEPIIMGNRLLLNTPTVLIGLVFWGFIWGIPGMILSVPLLVITKIILDRNTEFSILGRLMGYPEKVNKKNPN